MSDTPKDVLRAIERSLRDYLSGNDPDPVLGGWRGAMFRLYAYVKAENKRLFDEPKGEPDCIVCGGEGWVPDISGLGKQACPMCFSTQVDTKDT